MGIRDLELERLTKYAEGLGLRVVFKTNTKEDNAAEWTTDGTEITVFRQNNHSKTELLLTMIHELGHHVWFIHERDRKPDLRFDEALHNQDLFDTKVTKKPVPKRMRKKILEVEVAGAKWWETIYKETDMKFPLWKLHAAMEFDIWVYQEYYEHGLYPSFKRRLEKEKEIQAKYRPKKEIE